MTFHLKNNTWFVEDIALIDVAKQCGTPCFIYSQSLIQHAYQQYQQAVKDHSALICYAVKANNNLSILAYFAQLGAGFDIVSGGELRRVMVAGGQPEKVVFSGVGKSKEDIQIALQYGIRCFNIESVSELFRINEIASAQNKIAPLALRVNPDVDAKTHRHITTGKKENKFGLPYDQALHIYQQAKSLSNIHIHGISCHIGSQLLDPEPISLATEKLLILLEKLNKNGIEIQEIDLGGGLGVQYNNENVPTVSAYLQKTLAQLSSHQASLILAPGRSLIANAGVLLCRIEYLKKSTSKNFVVVNAAMNDLPRPAIYEAWHDIECISPNTASADAYDVVGPICESTDVLGRHRQLKVQEGDVLMIRSAGAYCMSMSSNYNDRPQAAEVLICQDQIKPIRIRQTYEQLYQNEIGLLKRLPINQID